MARIDTCVKQCVQAVNTIASREQQAEAAAKLKQYAATVMASVR
jgi:hypothetical protein